VVACPSGNVVGHINKATPRQARLVLTRVTICRYIILVRNQPLRPTQPPILSGTEMATSQEAVISSREGNRRSPITLAMHHRLWYNHLKAQWPDAGRWAHRLHSSKEYDTLSLKVLDFTHNSYHSLKQKSHKAAVKTVYLGQYVHPWCMVVTVYLLM